MKSGLVEDKEVSLSLYTSALEDIFHPCKLVVYADDNYVVASCGEEEKLSEKITIKMTHHFEWLE